jgi:phage shock protein PspC (stress-responsive transcriptional regulator)
MQQQAMQTFRRGKDRILGGVCSGLAEGLRIDPLWVRLGFVLLTFLQGVGLLIYIVLWLVMPEQVESQDRTRSGFDSMSADLKRIGAEVKAQFGGTPRPAPTQEQAAPSETPATSSNAPASTPSTGRTSIGLGVVLVAVGLILLGANTGLVQWSVIWPSVLIILGVLLLARTLDRRSQQ